MGRKRREEIEKKKGPGVGMMMKRVVYVGLLLEMLLLLLTANCDRAAAAAYVETNSSTSWCGGDGCFTSELEQDLELLVMEFPVSRMLEYKIDIQGTNDAGTTSSCGNGKPYKNCKPDKNKKTINSGIYNRESGKKPPAPAAYPYLTTLD